MITQNIKALHSDTEHYKKSNVKGEEFNENRENYHLHLCRHKRHRLKRHNIFYRKGLNNNRFTPKDNTHLRGEAAGKERQTIAV